VFLRTIDCGFSGCEPCLSRKGPELLKAFQWTLVVRLCARSLRKEEFMRQEVLDCVMRHFGGTLMEPRTATQSLNNAFRHLCLKDNGRLPVFEALTPNVRNGLYRFVKPRAAGSQPTSLSSSRDKLPTPNGSTLSPSNTPPLSSGSATNSTGSHNFEWTRKRCGSADGAVMKRHRSKDDMFSLSSLAATHGNMELSDEEEEEELALNGFSPERRLEKRVDNVGQGVESLLKQVRGTHEMLHQLSQLLEYVFRNLPDGMRPQSPAPPPASPVNEETWIATASSSKCNACSAELCNCNRTPPPMSTVASVASSVAGVSSVVSVAASCETISNQSSSDAVQP